MIIFVMVSTVLSTLMALMFIDRDKHSKLHDQVRPVTEKYQNIPRILLLIFVFMAAGILIAGYLFYSNYAKNYRTQVEHQLSAIADLKVGELVQWRKERLWNANLLYKNPAFSSLVQRYFEHPDDVDTQEQLRSWLTHFQVAFGQHASVFLLDPQGVRWIIVPDTSEPVPRHISQDAYQVLQSGKVTILDLERDEVATQPHIVVLTPIFREKDSNVPLGVVVMRIDPYQYLYPLIQKWPTPSTTAETLLVRRDGNDAVFLNELRFQKDTALKLRSSLENIKMPAVQAALGHEGIMEGIDYRGEPVIADIRRIPDSPWFMVARMDTSEVYAPLTVMLWVVISLIGALLISAAAGVGLVWRQQNIRVYKERAEIEDVLKESEEKYRLIIENSVDMIFTLNEKGEFLYLSPAFQRVMGYELSQMQGHPFQSFIHPDDVLTVEQALRDCIEMGKITSGLEYRIKYPSGDWCWHTTSCNRVLDKNGSFLHLVWIARDIAERRQAEDALRESEEQFRSSLENAPDGVFMNDLEGKFLYGNRRCEEIIGYKREELIGKNFLELNILPENSLARAAEILQDNINGKSTGPDELDLIRKDGRLVPVEINTTVVQGKGQAVVLAFVRDITERKLAEKNLARLHQQNELILSTVAEGIIGLDLQGNHTFVNPAAAKMLGYEVGELLSRPSHSTWHHTKPDGSPYPQEECAIYAAFRKGAMHRVYTEMFWRKDGTSFPIEYASTPIYEQGGLVGAVVTFADITERKLSEEKLVKSYESLQKSLNDSIDTIVKISEMRDPYTAGHQRKVADLATTIAREMKLEDTRIDQLRMAAVIHDIGKIYVPSEILSKPGKLSDIEFSLIKTHAQGGYDIVKDIDLPCSVANAVLQHHERLDGSGYPNGLKSEDTLLEAKILAVADVVEAMSSHRPYRPALGINKALEEISKNRGRLYDPDVVDVCLDLFNSGKFEFKSV